MYRKRVIENQRGLNQRNYKIIQPVSSIEEGEDEREDNSRLVVQTIWKILKNKFCFYVMNYQYDNDIMIIKY